MKKKLVLSLIIVFLGLLTIFSVSFLKTKQNKRVSSQHQIVSKPQKKLKKKISEKTPQKASHLTETSSKQNNPENSESTDTNSSTSSSSESQPSSSVNQNINEIAPQIAVLYNGDFSKIAGIWQNDKGESVTITSSGLISGQDSDTDKQITYFKDCVTNTYYSGTIEVANKEPGMTYTGVGSFIYVPVEVKTEYDQTSDSRDRVIIGQCPEVDFTHAFYKVQ